MCQPDVLKDTGLISRQMGQFSGDLHEGGFSLTGDSVSVIFTACKAREIRICPIRNSVQRPIRARPDLADMNSHSQWAVTNHESARHEAPLVGFTYGENWRADESPLQIIAQRCAFAASLRGEAPERSPKSRTSVTRCSQLAMEIDIITTRFHCGNIAPVAGL